MTQGFETGKTKKSEIRRQKVNTRKGIYIILISALINTFGCGRTEIVEQTRSVESHSKMPSLEVIKQHVAARHPRVSVLGLFRVSDSEYLVITDKTANEYGGPYKMYKLESGNWVINDKIGNLGTVFEIIDVER